MLVEVGEIRNDVFDNVGVWERIDFGFVLGICWDAACVIWTLVCLSDCSTTRGQSILTQASQSIRSIDVHSAASTNTLSTTSSKSQGRIHLILDPD